MSSLTISVPNCSVSLQWSLNSLGQSPCQVAGYLGAVCTNGSSTLVSITNTTDMYTGPSVPTNCTCSTVYYSALSACSSCQGAEYVIWMEWSKTCNVTYNASYPNPVPPETAIPHWAFQSYSQDYGASFNIELAQAQGDLPESTFTSEPNAATSSSSTSKNTELGAKVVGGVIGTLALLVMLNWLGLWLQRRKWRAEELKQAETSSISDTIPYGPPATDNPRQLRPPSTNRAEWAELQRRTEELVQSIVRGL
ncbi:hypothetical protein BDP27DRAFT_595734 [Rhodocollybia butyracea]|uniref:Uncharacterized protein n=1 Tax=Rhodocollybia butyracea TaxID=206335 RepID=A0A9P5P6U1_9AGAR|nr:hypothetical protein BDP27DRAFT_595734 [Rhodocollybia butyracea]